MTIGDRYLLFQKVLLGFTDKEELIQALKSDTHTCWNLTKKFEETLDAQMMMFKDIPAEVKKTILKWQESFIDNLIKEKGENFTEEELNAKIIEKCDKAQNRMFPLPTSLLN